MAVFSLSLSNGSDPSHIQWLAMDNAMTSNIKLQEKLIDYIINIRFSPLAIVYNTIVTMLLLTTNTNYVREKEIEPLLLICFSSYLIWLWSRSMWIRYHLDYIVAKIFRKILYKKIYCHFKSTNFFALNSFHS